MTPTPWANRITRTGQARARDLLANPLNARHHPPPQRAALQALLDSVGWVGSVLVSERSGLLADGHLRVELAAERDEEIPVNWVDLNEQEEAAVLALFDPIGALASTDAGLYASLVDVAGPVIPAGLEFLTDMYLPEIAPELTPDEPGEAPEPNPRAKVGDIWVLEADGITHRLACGDSMVMLPRLMDGRKAAALITDPPYGIDYGDTVEFRRTMGKTQRATNDSHVANDGLSDAADIWAAVFPLVSGHMAKKSAFYCWSPSGSQQSDLAVALRTAGLTVHGSVIWVKSSFSFSRADHKYQHEPCWYGWLTKGTHDWQGPNNETSVWEYPKPSVSEFHPTQKPVDLIRRCVRNITPAGGVVLDPFGGSGTTMIAAHLERKPSRLVELNPRYVDIILTRFENLFGGTITLEVPDE